MPSGFAISTSGFNQLLRAQIETGLLQSTITAIDLGSGPIALTAGLFAALFPEFGVLPPATPIAIRIAPTIAPVLTGQTGPAGELGEIRMSHIRAEFVQNIGLPTETVHLALASDARVGLQLAFQPGGIGFVLQPPAPDAGSNFESQDPAEAHFGLGKAKQVDELRVVWPDGTATVRSGVAPNQWLLFEAAPADGASCSEPAPANGCTPASGAKKACLLEWRGTPTPIR